MLVLQSANGAGLRSLLFLPECNILRNIMENLEHLDFEITSGRPYRTTYGNLMVYIKLGNEIM